MAYKNIIYAGIALCTALLVLRVEAAAAGAGEGDRTITIAADDWCPVNCDPAGGREGLGVDLARRVFEPLGYRVRYIVVPWARAVDDVRQGRVDAVIGANTADDSTLVFPRESLCRVSDDFYALREKRFSMASFDDLRHKRVGIVSDYGYGEKTRAFLARHHRQAGMVQVVSGEDALDQNIKKLRAGRIDVLVEAGLIMDDKLKVLDLTDRIIRIGSFPQGFVYLAFSPVDSRSRALAALYDAGIARLRVSGGLAEIYGRYGLKAPP